MNEEKIREIVEKVIAENMPNKDEITQKAIEAVKESEKKENDKPWLIKKRRNLLCWSYKRWRNKSFGKKKFTRIQERDCKVY